MWYSDNSAVYTHEETGKSQADGAVVIDVSDAAESAKSLTYWQLQFTLSDVPTAGTAQIAVKTPGADGFVTLATEVDLVNGPLLVSFTAAAEAIRITPVGLDADKTYDCHLAAT